MANNASQGKHAAGNTPASFATSDGQPLQEGQALEAGQQASTRLEASESGEKILWVSDASGEWKPVELKKKRHPGRIVAAVLGVLVVLVAAVYGVGYWYFSNHFYPNSIMTGLDISQKTSEEVVQIAESAGDNYTLVVKGDGAQFTVTAKDVAAGVDGSAVVRRAFESNDVLRWPLHLSEDHDYSELLIEEFSEGGFEKELRKQIDEYNKTAVDPVDAFIEYNAEEKRYEVVPEVPGTKLMAEPIVKAAVEAIVAMEPEVQIPDGSLVPPALLSTDEKLVKAVEEANKYSAAKIELVLGTTEIHAATIDASQVSQWVSIDKDYKVKFDEEAMNKWIHDLAYSLDTIGTERSYTRPDGNTYTVSGGTYGWEIDSEALIVQLRDGIKEGFQGKIVAPTLTEGYTWNGVGQPDWGNYADVDLSEQHARFYNVDGELLWESDFISGSPDGVHDTSTGIWRVLYKESPSILRGEMQSDGRREYETQVQYWMQFTYSGIGFHDATWQWAFGGNSYAIGYGSHGCVNLPYDAAEQLYGIIEPGNAVIVHW